METKATASLEKKNLASFDNSLSQFCVNNNLQKVKVQCIHTFIFQEDSDHLSLAAAIFNFNGSAVEEWKLVPDGMVDQSALLFGRRCLHTVKEIARKCIIVVSMHHHRILGKQC